MADSSVTEEGLAQELDEFLSDPAWWGKEAPELIAEWGRKKVDEDKVDPGICNRAIDRVINQRFRRH